MPRGLLQLPNDGARRWVQKMDAALLALPRFNDVRQLHAGARGIDVAVIVRVGMPLAGTPERRTVVVQRHRAQNHLIPSVAVHVRAKAVVRTLPLITAGQLFVRIGPEPVQRTVFELPGVGQHQIVGAAQRKQAGRPSIQIGHGDLVARGVIVVSEGFARRPCRAGALPTGDPVEHRQPLRPPLDFAFGVAHVLVRADLGNHFGASVAVQIAYDHGRVPHAALDVPPQILDPQQCAVVPPRLELEGLRRLVPVFVPRIDIAAGLLDHVIEPAVAVQVAHADFLRGHVRRGQRDAQIRRPAPFQRERAHRLRSAREAGCRLDRVTHCGIKPVRIQKIGGLRERRGIEFDTATVLQTENVKRDLGIILAQQAPAQVDALRHFDRQRAAAHRLDRTRLGPTVNLGPPDHGRLRFRHDLHVIHPTLGAPAAHDAHVDRIDRVGHRKPRLAALPSGAARLGCASDRPTDQLFPLVAHHLNGAGTRVTGTLHPAGDRI